MRSVILISVIISTLMVQEISGAFYQLYDIEPDARNCSYTQESFTEVFDTPRPLNTTRWDVWSLEFGWEKGAGFKSINNWTYIEGLGNYNNAEPGVQIPGSNLKGLRLRTTKTPCKANPKFCTKEILN